MKKHHFIFTVLALVIISGCSLKQPNASQTTDNDSGSSEPDRATICSGICGRVVQDLCRNEIDDAGTNGQNLDGNIMDEASCQLMCEADWDDSIIGCVSDAADCAQLSSDSPYCIDNSQEDDDSGTDVTLPGNCDKACKNYAKCTGYGNDITPADQEDAYKSCLQVCGTWSEKGRNCMANTNINKASDCAAQTMCILGDLNKMVK